MAISATEGPGLDHVIARWNALLDRGIEETHPRNRARTPRVNQGRRRYVGADQGGVRTFSPSTRSTWRGDGRISLELYLPAGLQRQLLRRRPVRRCLSDVVATRVHNGFIPSLSRSIASSRSPAPPTAMKYAFCICLFCARHSRSASRRSPRSIGAGSFARIPEPLRADFPCAQRRAASIFTRTSHAPSTRGRLELHGLKPPFRDTAYTISQTPRPDSDYWRNSHHQPRSSEPHWHLEASVDVRPPALERDFDFPAASRAAPCDRARADLPLRRRHRPAGAQRAAVRHHRHRHQHQRAGFSLTQRFYMRRQAHSPAARSTTAIPIAMLTARLATRTAVPTPCASGQAGRLPSRRSSIRTLAAR